MVPGLTGKSEMIVRDEDVASHLGDVYIHAISTPRLIRLMESAAIEAIQEALPSDQISLGILVKIKHLSPTPVGMKIVAHALLKEVNKNRLLFLVDAYDELEKVAEGEHERIIVFRERFLQRLDKKRAG